MKGASKQVALPAAIDPVEWLKSWQSVEKVIRKAAQVARQKGGKHTPPGGGQR